LNPADITKLGCLVGKFSGQVFNHTTGQLTNQACEVQLSASGRLSMTIGGQSVYDQPLSTQAAILDVDQDPTNVSSLYVKEQTGEISLGNLNSDTQGFFIGVIPPASNETLWKLIGIKATQTGPTDNDIDYQTCVATK
jgi:hypothetical protein